jgi:hypothetical protein
MTVDNIDTLEEPPPLRRQLLLLLSFWILPFWCFSNAVAGVLALPHSFWRLEFTLVLCLAGFMGMLSWMLSTIRHSSVSDYSFTGYYWITWMIAVVFAPGLDSLYYAAIDWQVAVLPNDTIMPVVIYGGIYYLLPASSLFILGQMSWEYYSAYDSSVDWASILVDNTTFVAALLIWDASLSDSQWLFTTISGYLYYLLPRAQRNNFATKLSCAKRSSSVASTIRKPFTVLAKR